MDGGRLLQKLVEIDEESFWCISKRESSDPTDSIPELLPGSQFSNEIFAVRIKGSCLRYAGLIMCEGGCIAVHQKGSCERGAVTDTHICMPSGSSDKFRKGSIDGDII